MVAFHLKYLSMLLKITPSPLTHRDSIIATHYLKSNDLSDIMEYIVEIE